MKSESNSTPIPTDPRFQDLTGKVFSRLSVTGYAGKSGHSHRWLCRCECGNDREVRAHNLTRGNSKSCGCISLEIHTKHGMARRGEPKVEGAKRRVLPEYRAWTNMWARTTNPNNPGYALYADRAPPDAWRDFSVFLKDVGMRPAKGLSLDRIDNSKPYGPGNCRWASRKEQSNNTSRNVELTHAGETLTIAQWAEMVGIGYVTLGTRLKRGWSTERALTEPVHKK